MAHNVMRWTTRTGGTVDFAVAADVAEDVTVHPVLSGFPPSQGAVLYHKANEWHHRVERPIAAAVATPEEAEGGGGSRATGQCRPGRGTRRGPLHRVGQPAEPCGAHGRLTRPLTPPALN